MDTALIQSSVTSFMIICVIIVFAQIFMRSRFFSEVYEQHPIWTTQVVLILFFGLLSVFGSSTGLLIYGAAVNVRDLGPMAAGLICGPFIGIGSGIIGGGQGHTFHDPDPAGNVPFRGRQGTRVKVIRPLPS